MTQLTLERFESSTASALHAPDPETDAAAEAAEEAEALELERTAAQTAREEAIAAALGQIADAIVQSRKGAIEAVCADLGDVLAQALPGIITVGFANELAEASAALINDAGIAEASLRVSPEDKPVVVAVIKQRAPVQEVAVVSDPSIRDGFARLDWNAGGTVFDALAWSERMKQLLTAHLEARRNEGMET